MKQASRVLLIVMLLAFLVLLGCSSKGTMNVNNNTNGQLTVNIDGAETVVESGESASRDWNLKDWFLNHESKDITVSGRGDYKIHFSYNYEIKPNKDNTLNIIADAGRVCFHNNSLYPLTEVYIANQGAHDWGYDWLIKPIEPVFSNRTTINGTFCAVKYSLLRSIFLSYVIDKRLARGISPVSNL